VYLNFVTKQMHRLYSADVDGLSFDCLEFALSGYDGPTTLVIKTTKNEVIGAFAHGTWKDSVSYRGCSDCFIFQLQPRYQISLPTGDGDRFMYMHSSNRRTPLQPSLEGLPHGISFGGSATTKPRLFIPDTLERCTAGFMDDPYQAGDLLPDEDLERFEIACLEVWAVGDENVIQHALKKRDAYRVHQAEFLKKARTVEDRTQFADDLASDLMAPSKLFKHREEARGRHEFAVDDKHGGYKLDRE
jgi:hypothetical protein